MRAKRNHRDEELRAWFAQHPWRYGIRKKVDNGPPRFDSGLIKPAISVFDVMEIQTEEEDEEAYRSS